jgi:Zn ribbon nucleic-acid-binding protein
MRIAGESPPSVACTIDNTTLFVHSARVAYAKVERQFKIRGIPFMNVIPASPGTPAHIQSCLARSIPALCVQSSDILSGAPAAEAAMPNIRVIPLNWWSEKKVQVVTCVKLKYVQQPIGKKARTSNIIRPTKAIIYDTTEAVVSFLSEDVDKCVDEFLEEWANVSKMVVIAREGTWRHLLGDESAQLSQSCSNGESEALVRCEVALVRLTDCGVRICIGMPLLLFHRSRMTNQ